MSRYKKKSSQPKNWYRLDNAAKIYPVLMRSRHGGYFRLAVLLHEPVDPVILQQALEATLKRFPFFAVRLRRGLFWYYLESYDGIPKIEPDVQNPMRPWTRKEIKKFLFRVRYDQKRISVEFFHALTDGSGGMVFLKTLAAAYLRLRGDFCGIGAGALDINRPADSDEMEDAYKRYSNFRVVHRPRETKAFHLQGTIMPGHWLQIISGVLLLDRVKSVARSYGISVTNFWPAFICTSYTGFSNKEATIHWLRSGFPYRLMSVASIHPKPFEISRCTPIRAFCRLLARTRWKRSSGWFIILCAIRLMKNI